jgi:hypothetical protein
MKILALSLLIFLGCKVKIHQKINTLHSLIFEYTGQVNKPIPTLVFCDSSIRNFKMNYYDSFILENETLDNLSACVPEYSDTITPTHYPLYKITSIYEKYQNIKYITSPQTLNLFFDCLEKYITKNNFYNAYIELENARAMNPI